jgi:anti-anti-sigma regulatory factor
VRHTLAPAVSGFVDSIMDRMEDDSLVFDLCEAEAIDSTNLGEIARIADRLQARTGKRAAIISTRPEINQVLFSMAFDEVFDICTEAPAPAGGQPIPHLAASRELSLRIILAAHRRLMEMSESNRTQFSEVVELMERELEASASQGDGRGS